MIGRWKIRLGVLVSAALAVPPVAGQAAIPQGTPFALRGVELGITLDQFRRIEVPMDDPRYVDGETQCSTDDAGGRPLFMSDSQDKADGIVECRWFSRRPGQSLWEHWIYIGSGKGQPAFRFIAKDGELRLFQIWVYANISYYNGIRDALTRGYGAPRDVVEPFKTTAGGDFTSVTSNWSNPLSSIRLVQRCGHLERYCLTYNHADLIKLYDAVRERRAASAAEKI